MKGEMTFKRVYYKYGYGRDVLSDINLTIPQRVLRWLLWEFQVQVRRHWPKMMVNFTPQVRGD